MKSLIISDSHSKSPVEFIQEMREKQGIGRIICLGDYDSPEVLEKILMMDIPKIVLPGNHDYPLMKESLLNFDEEDVIRPDYLIETISPERYKANLDYWKKSKTLRNFAMQWLKEIDRDKKFIKEETLKTPKTREERKVCFVHGGLSDPDIEPEDEYKYGDERPHQLWQRIVDTFTGTRLFPPAIENQMLRMKELKYWLLFKGHDHLPKAFSLEMGACPSGNYKDILDHLNPLAKEQTLELEEGRRYFIAVGNFSLDRYAIWNDTKGTITFYANDEEKPSMKVVPESFFIDKERQ